MKIQGSKLKQGEEPKKTALYEFREPRTISFLEKHTGETVDVSFRLKGEQKGFYAEEYRPATISKDGAKVLDITAFILDEAGETKTCGWYLFDVKTDVGGEDDIFHMWEQWTEGLQYLKNSVLNYLQGYRTQQHIGVITRHFDTERMDREIASRKERIAEMESQARRTLAGRKKLLEKPALKKETELLENVRNQFFFYWENGSLRRCPFEVRILTEKAPGKFHYCLTAEIS